MKKIINISFFILGLFVNGQINNARLIYKIEPFTEKGPSEIEGFYEQARKDLKEVTFTMYCTPENSIFYSEKKLSGENNLNIDLSLKMVEAQGNYYTNLKENISLHQMEAYGEIFIIESTPYDFEWTIHKESKKIGDFTCYKATTNYLVRNSLKEFVHPVVAWFCPEIVLKYGPKNYSGLPGLILELREKDNFYFLSSIKFNDLSENEFDKIKKPTKGKVVSKSEFEEIGIKISKQFRGDKK